MVSLSTWFRYLGHKIEYSASLGWKSYQRGQISEREVGDAVWKNLFQGKLTYLLWSEGKEMAPAIGAQGGTLLVRKLPVADPISEVRQKWCPSMLRGRHGPKWRHLLCYHKGVAIGGRKIRGPQSES